MQALASGSRAAGGTSGTSGTKRARREYDDDAATAQSGGEHAVYRNSRGAARGVPRSSAPRNAARGVTRGAAHRGRGRGAARHDDVTDGSDVDEVARYRAPASAPHGAGFGRKAAAAFRGASDDEDGSDDDDEGGCEGGGEGDREGDREGGSEGGAAISDGGSRNSGATTGGSGGKRSGDKRDRKRSKRDDGHGHGHGHDDSGGGGGGGGGGDGDGDGDGRDNEYYEDSGDEGATAAAAYSARISAALVDLCNAPNNGAEDRMSDEELKDALAVLHAHWTARLGSGGETVRDGMVRFQLGGGGAAVGAKDVTDAYLREVWRMTRLQFQFVARNLVSDPSAGGGSCGGDGGGDGSGGGLEDVGGAAHAGMLARLWRVIAQWKEALLADLRLRRTLDPTIDAAAPALPDPFGYMPIDLAAMNDGQKLTLYMLRALQAAGYRRYKGAAYAQIMSPPVACVERGPDGVPYTVLRAYPTHAWRHAADIADFVMDACNKEDHFTQWCHLTKMRNQEAVEAYLKHCRDPEFAELAPDRHWYAFHNGLLHTATCRFHRWGSPAIPPDVVAVKYIDLPFNEAVAADTATHWYNIDTPAMQGVLEFQLEGEPQMHEVIMWFYIMFGRLLFEVNEKDTWQIILCIIGRAGTGKSTVLDLLQELYMKEDVEVVSSKGRSGNGDLETLLGKKLWMIRELKADLTLDQGQLQSMITGETMSITRLYKSNLTVTWTVPGIIAGNEAAAWSDNSGSISRRMLMTGFERRVDAVDTSILPSMRAQLPRFLYKICAAYQQAVEHFGHVGIWSTVPVYNADGTRDAALVVPRYFHEQREKLRAMTHPLEAFLRAAEGIRLVPRPRHGEERGGMPFDRFQELARAYFERNNIRSFQWKGDKYAIALENHDVVMRALGAREGRDYNGSRYGEGDKWLWGVVERDAAADAAAAAALSAVDPVAAAADALAAAAANPSIEQQADADAESAIVANTNGSGASSASASGGGVMPPPHHRRRRARATAADAPHTAATAAAPHRGEALTSMLETTV